MKNICAIFDTDEQYARKLMNVMNSRQSIMYRTIMFTNETALYEYLEHEIIQLLIIGEELILEKCRNLQAEKVKRTVILTENECVSKECARAGLDEIKIVYKYQSSEKLMHEIIGNDNQAAKTMLQDRQITGVYSPIHYTGKTSFSLALAKAYAKSGRRTLYINLEEFSGLSEILPDINGISLSDAIYCYKTNHEGFKKDFEQFVCSTGNISYIPPIKCAEDICSLNTDEWINFILSVSETGMYEVLVLDVANASGEPWNILEVCTRVIMPVREDYISRQKIKDFDEFMSALGREKICQITEKMLLPKDANSQLSRDFLDMVEYGTLGKHAREIVRGNSFG